MSGLSDGRIFRIFFLLLGLFVMFLPNNSKAAEVTFHKVFLGTANDYSRNSSIISVKSPLIGSSFKFISNNPENPLFFAGANDIEGKLQYVDAFGNTVTIFGAISRKSSKGSTTQSFYFAALTDTGTYNGLAYLLIMDPYQDLFKGNQSVETNTAGLIEALNAYLLGQSKTFFLSAASGSVNETGTTSSFTIVLSSQPATNKVVVLDISCNDATEASASPTSLTFTAANWNTPQTVTITGLDDQDLDGTQMSVFTISVNKSGTSDETFYYTSFKTYEVSTLDNDHSITISGLGIVMSSYIANISIAENNSSVTTYSASKTANWSISGTDAFLFNIGTDGGLVFKSAPDYELPIDANKDNIYEIIVEAADGSGNKGTQTLLVVVKDVDDTVPGIVGPGGATFPASANVSISITENSSAVFTYTSNEAVSWSIVGTDASLFNIGTDGGLVFRLAPDFEQPADANKDNIYEIIIEAADGSGNKGTQSLLVMVRDLDDTAPSIVGPGSAAFPANANISIAENNPAVFSYTSNEAVSWSIAGLDASLFNIGTDGKLVFSLPPNYELPSDRYKNNKYSLLVKAKDFDGNETSQSLTIIVTNVNEAPENITLTKSAIYEKNMLNALIANLGSNDVDEGDTFKYSLVGGDVSSFIIAGNELKANEIFVYGTKSVYEIIIRTTDAGGLSFDKAYNINIIQSPLLMGITNLSGIKKSFQSGVGVSISKGHDVNLNVSGSDIVSYGWSPVAGLSSSNISSPIANPSKTTTYTVTVINAQGISAALSITVTVLEDYNIRPNNVISPDGDGVNDTWLVENLSAYPDNEINIYNKGGRLIYTAKNYQNDWYGQYNGNTTHGGGIYYYVINLGRGTKPRVGYLTLLTN